VAGAEVFARRDVAATTRLPIPGLPAPLLGTHGPFSRSLGDLLPASVAWGLGLGVYGLVMAATSGAVTVLFKESPAVLEAMSGYLPGLDLATAAGFLQLAFVDLGFVLMGLVAVTLVAGRSADETSGRLELQLTTPLSRALWASASGLAVFAAILVVTAVLAVAIGVGVALAGDDPLAPAAGTFVLAAYAAALAGIGLAAGGLFRASLAAPLVLVLTIGTFLVDLLAPALRLPDWVANLALTSHMGQPMVGEWSVPGIAACLALAAGGLVLGAWGMGRRDVGA
jgi:ABC-2 type transport system permease protein